MILTGSQHADWERDGFLVLDDILSAPAALDAVRDDYDALLSALYRRLHAEGRVEATPASLDFFGRIAEATRAGIDWFQPLDISLPGGAIAPDTPFHTSQPVLDMMTDSRILDTVEALIGPEITSVPIQHVRIKPPAPLLRGGESAAHVTPTAWHQDRGVAQAEADATDMVTVWIAVTDADEENGCLTAIPGAHRAGMLPHCPLGQTAIPPDRFDERHAVPIPVRAGGAVFLHPLTPHASLPNGTDRFRWSFDLRYAVTGQPTGRSHFPSFVARSRARPGTELRDADRWRALWRSARAACAARAPVPIHRWTAASPACA